MAVSTQVVRFTKDATNVDGATQDVTLSFTPKAIIVMSSGSTTDNTFGDGYNAIYGFSDGTTQACVSAVSQDLAASGNTGRTHRTDSVFCQLDPADGTTILSRASAAFSTNKVTLTWTVNDSLATYLILTAYGGTDITNTKVNTVTVSTNVTGTHDYTGLGFNPTNGNSVLFVLTSQAASAGGYNVNQTTVDATFSFGCATSSTKRWSISNDNEDVTSSMDTDHYFVNDECLVAVSANASGLRHEADFNGWIDDGFQLDFEDAPSSIYDYFSYLVIKGGTWDCGSDTTAASATTKNHAVSVASNTIRGLMVVSASFAETAFNSALAVNAGYTVGATDGTNYGFILSTDYNGAADAVTACLNSGTTRMIGQPSVVATAASSTWVYQGTLSSIGTDQFTMSYTGTVASIILAWVVVADGEAVTAVEKALILRYNLEQAIAKQLILRYNLEQEFSKALTVRYNVTTLVEKQLTTRYNLEQTILKQLLLRYNLEQQITKPLTLRYDIIALVAKQLTLRYDVTKLVEKTLTLRHNLEQQIQKVLNLRYDVTKLVEKPLTVRYNLEQTIEQVLSLRYNIDTLVEKALTLRYDIEEIGLAAVEKILNLRYDISKEIPKSLTTRYNIEQQIQKALSLRYDLTSLVEKALNLKYNLEQQIEKTLNLRYDVTSLVDKQLTLRYALEQTIEKILIVRYDIESFLTVIEKALTLRYNLEQQITKELIARYDVANEVPPKSLTIRYNIEKTIEKALLLRYDIESALAAIEKALILRYNLEQQIPKQLTTRYDINAKVPDKALTIRYDITKLVEKTLILRHKIEQAIAKVLSLRYDVTALTEKPLTLRHNIEQLITKPLNLRYHITALAEKILNLRYNIEQTIQKQLTARYNVEQQIPKPLTVRYNIEQQIIKPLALRYDVTAEAIQQLILRYNLEQQILKQLTLRYDVEAESTAVSVQVIRFQKNATGTPGATQDVTLNFTPKAIIVFSQGNNVDSTTTANYQWIQGFSDGTNHACIAIGSLDAVSGSSNTYRSHRNDSVFIHLTEATGAIASRATCAFTTNKVTFTWAQNDTAATYITMMAYGGPSIINAKVNTVNVTKSGTGTQDYTGLGFNPAGNTHSVLFTLMAGRTTSGESTDGALGSFGAAVSTTGRFVAAVSSQDAVSPTVTRRIHRNDGCLYQFTTAGAVDGYADFSAWITDGFRLNWVDAISDTTLDFSYLVINGGIWDVGSFISPSSSPLSQTITANVPESPIRGLLLGSSSITTINTITTNNIMDMGATDGTNTSTIGVIDETAVVTSDAYRVNDTTKIVHRLTTDGSTQMSATFTSLGINQFTLQWIGPEARTYGYIVIAGTPPPPVELTKELILRYDISQQILKELILRYTLEGKIEKLLRLRYDVINTIPKQLTLRYNITNLVEKQITLRYTIGQTIQKLLMLRYNLEQTIQKQLTTRYNITKLVQKQLLLRYNVQKEIIKQLTLLYSSEAQLTKTLEILYQIQGWGARSQTISDATYKEPLRCRIRFIDRKNPNKVHYTYDSFATDTRPFNLLSCTVRLAQGEIGAFSFSIEDSAKVVNLNNIGYNARVEIDVKKIAAEDWTRLMTGYVRRVQRVRSATNTLIYTVNGYGLQVVFNERITNFKRAAKRTQVDSIDPLPTDSNMFASTLFADLITATDVMPLKGPSLATQAGFTIDDINVDVRDFIAQISPGLTDAAQVANALSELTGAIWGVNNEGNPFFRYPTQRHSGIIIKDDPADTDSAISTAINLGSFDFEDSIDLAEGFANRLYVLNAVSTQSTASSSKALGYTSLSFRGIAQQFTATDNNITDAAFILSKVGNPTSQDNAVIGYLRGDNNGWPNGPTLARFEISFASVETTKSTIFVNDIKTETGVINPGQKYWWFLFAALFDDSNTIRWHHDNDNQTINRFSATLPLIDQDPTKPGSQLFWTRSDKGPVYAFSTFSSIRHVIEHSDSESIDRYGLVEGVVDLPAFEDDATFQKALTQILKTSSKPKRIYEYQQVTIPSTRLFMPGELITLVDSKADLDSDKNVTAEISEVLYSFSTDSNAVGCKYVNLRAMSFIDKILDDYLNSGAVCSE